MPDPGSLIRIRQRLFDAMRVGRSLEPDLLVDQVSNRAIWREVDRTFNAVEGMPPAKTLVDAVLGYLHLGAAENFAHLKNVCYGIALPFHPGGERLIDRAPTLRQLLEDVDRYENEGRLYRRCYQALMQSFFNLEPDMAPGGFRMDGGMTVLRAYLSARIGLAAPRVGGGHAPTWVLTLQEHSNLLSEAPCDRYVADLQHGRTDGLASACATLGISSNSWVWQAVILAYLKEICARPDDAFKAAIETALDVADGGTTIKPHEPVARLIVGALVKRYRTANSHPEHARLRDAAVVRIGNPWLQRGQWDAWVGDEPARQMVDGWLKSRLMEDFFTLLSDQGGGTDRRRLHYWLRFVPVISDMWFVLGVSARQNPTAEFLEMRKRMTGRRLDLVQSSDEHNNAFVMRIGEHYFVEFGVKGNACYHYTVGSFPHNLRERQVSIHTLKRGGRPAAHSHLPSGSWEVEFDRKFCPLIGFVPPGGAVNLAQRASRPAIPNPSRQTAPSSRDERIAAVLQRCSELHVPVDDRRSKGGSLWVALPANQLPVLRKQLELCGFRFSQKLQKYYLDAGY